MRLGHERGKGCARLPFLSEKPRSVKDDCAIGSSSSPRCQSLHEVSVQLDQRLLISLFFLQPLPPLGVQKAFHFVIIGEEQSPRRDSRSAVSSTVESVIDVDCDFGAVRVGCCREWTEEFDEFVRSFGNGWQRRRRRRSGNKVTGRSSSSPVHVRKRALSPRRAFPVCNPRGDKASFSSSSRSSRPIASEDEHDSRDALVFVNTFVLFGHRRKEDCAQQEIKPLVAVRTTTTATKEVALNYRARFHDCEARANIIVTSKITVSEQFRRRGPERAFALWLRDDDETSGMGYAGNVSA